MCEMGKNHSSLVVLCIWPKCWWMLPMGVRDNHTKYELETQWWRPGTGVASAGPPLQNLQFGAKISLSLPKTALEPAENGQMKPVSFLTKVIFFFAPGDPFWHPPLWATSCSLPQPTGPRYGGLGVG